MPITPEEASRTLDEINRTADYSRELNAYSEASPHFLLWGLVWAFGYTVTDFAPDMRNLAWGIGVATGAVGSIFIASSRKHGQAGAGAGFRWRYAAISGGLAAFFGVMSSVLHLEPRQVDAFVPLIFSGIYLFAGLYAGLRFSLATIVLVTLLRLIHARPH